MVLIILYKKGYHTVNRCIGISSKIKVKCIYIPIIDLKTDTPS